MFQRPLRGWQSLLLLLAWLPALVLAAIDPPARVGRLGLIENEVDFLVDRNDRGSPATTNWPISSGAGLVSTRHGRAEAWIGSTAYRLAGDSRLEFADVDDQRVDLDLQQGSLTVSILDRDQADDVTVHTPDGRIRFATPGRYRIDVGPEGTELTTQAGRASLDQRSQAVQVVAGRKAILRSNGQLTLTSDLDQDAFDQWVAARENATLADDTRRHVSPRMTGYQELDAYGDWQTTADYGSVWYPRRVADDWAPYRFGRWAWVAPWGWTWIDRSPWGFAPFHYGRWLLIDGRWAWLPGSQAVHPVYAPAVVGWIGQPGWSLSFSSGPTAAVGWFPLAPHEVYVPPHRHTTRYVHRINDGHVHDRGLIDRARRGDHHPHFVHRNSPNAVTVVPASVVRDGRSVEHGGHNRLGRLPPGGHTPDNRWLRPNDGAMRPQHEERRDPPNRRSSRDSETPARPGADPGTHAPRPRINQESRLPSADEASRGGQRVDQPPRSPRLPQRGQASERGNEARPTTPPENHHERAPNPPDSGLAERRPPLSSGPGDTAPQAGERPGRRPAVDRPRPADEPDSRHRPLTPGGERREGVGDRENSGQAPRAPHNAHSPSSEREFGDRQVATPRRDEGRAPRRQDHEAPASRPPARPAAPAPQFQSAPRPAAPPSEPRQPAREPGKRHGDGERGGR